MTRSSKRRGTRHAKKRSTRGKRCGTRKMKGGQECCCPSGGRLSGSTCVVGMGGPGTRTYPCVPRGWFQSC